MPVQIREILAKNILSESKVYDYALNPYAGCQHNCIYCYARFMKRFTGHKEPWGEFVDVKINAPELLAREVMRKKVKQVWISGVCDPYQPLEKKYRLTQKCLEILAEHGWPVSVQTKSPLVLRDLPILKRFEDVEVCLTVTTADEKMRRIFEPGAPPIKERIGALEMLHSEGITTSAMIAPILPGAERLVAGLTGKVDSVLIDRLNYHYADRVYRNYRLEWAKESEFFRRTAEELKRGFDAEGIPCEVLF